ncbi:hypothetical protein ECE50_010160 [Chitinophaga sp. Mgbs1]|uniref:Uncharacterized protein n=1 Tax=Chitinophaga solisilvae TaxID=1233460 RepID=A0A433WDD6_9BACT|nr:hypothetical protein [Chitinophaga solisilvae]
MNNAQPVYVSNAVFQLGKSKNWSSILVLEYVNDMARKGKVLSAQDIQKIKNAADKIYSAEYPAYREKKFDSEWVQARYDFYQDIRKVGFVGADYLGDYFSKKIEEVYEASALNVTKDINLQKQSEFSKGIDNAERVLNETYSIAATDPAFKESIDNVFSHEFNSLLDNSEKEIRTANAEFDSFLKVNGLVNATGEILSGDAELKSVINAKLKSVLDAVQSGQEEVVKKIDRIGAKVEDMGSKVDYLFEKIRTEQEEKNRIALQNWEDYSVQSIISLATNIIGDPNLTKGVTAVASAAFQIKSLSAQYNSIQQMSALGSLGLISGYAGVALSLYNAFNAPEQQNADAIILQNLQKISEQIEALRKQVMEGISILDKKIDAYFEITNENIKYIIQFLQGMDVDLDNVGDSLKNISLQINLYWKDVKTKLDYLINDDIEDLKSDIENFKSTYDREMTVDEYKAYMLRVFNVYEESKKAVFTGNKEAIGNERQLFVEIENKGAAELINLLRAIISANSEYKLFKERVNPDRLSICMNLLTRLAIDNPHTFREIKPTKYQELYEEFRIQRKEIAEIRANKNNSLVSVFKRLIAGYLQSVEDFQKEVMKIYREELIKNVDIKDKSNANLITNVLEIYFELSNFTPGGFNMGMIDRYIRMALDKLTFMEFEHAPYSDWRIFINAGNGTVDFSLPEAYIESNSRYRGNAGFPKVFLTENPSRELLDAMPSLILLLSFDAVDLERKYFSSYVNFTKTIVSAPGVSITPYEKGKPAIYYRLLWNGMLLGKPEIVSPVINFISPAYMGQEQSITSLKDLCTNYYFWYYIPDSGSNFPEFEVHRKELNDRLTSIVTAYLLQVQSRVLHDLNDMSTDLFKMVAGIEGNASLIKLMLNYLFNGINDDLLNYLTGDIRTRFNINEFKFTGGNGSNYLPLLNAEYIQLIISSLSIDKSDIFGSLLGRDFQLFNTDFEEKCKETTEVMVAEIQKYLTADTLNSFQQITDNQVLFEMLLASK